MEGSIQPPKPLFLTIRLSILVTSRWNSICRNSLHAWPCLRAEKEVFSPYFAKAPHSSGSLLVRYHPRTVTVPWPELSPASGNGSPWWAHTLTIDAMGVACNQAHLKPPGEGKPEQQVLWVLSHKNAGDTGCELNNHRVRYSVHLKVRFQECWNRGWVDQIQQSLALALSLEFQIIKSLYLRYTRKENAWSKFILLEYL